MQNRNVTQFFVSNKDKPIVIETKKNNLANKVQEKDSSIKKCKDPSQTSKSAKVIP
jgi:hypothetical protein